MTLKEKLESEIIDSQAEVNAITNTQCSHITCPSCQIENAQKEEQRKVINENIRVKREIINSLVEELPQE